MAEVRSLRPDVRNPLLALPAMQKVMALSPEVRAVLCALLVDIRDYARANAEKSWRKSKAPMALYWKVVGVYAEHIRRAIRPQIAAKADDYGPDPHHTMESCEDHRLVAAGYVVCSSHGVRDWHWHAPGGRWNDGYRSELAAARAALRHLEKQQTQEAA